MKKFVCRCMVMLVLVTGISMICISCLTPPPGPDHRNNRGRGGQRQGPQQPGPNRYEPEGSGVVFSVEE